MSQPTKRESIDEIVVGREATYGSFFENAALRKELKALFRAQPKWENLDPDMQEALEMIVLKITRILHGDCTVIDNWIDIQGYARLVSNRLIEDEKSTLQPDVKLV